VVVGIDKPGHDNAAGCVNHGRVARLDVLFDVQDFLTLDQHVGLREVADAGIQRHGGTAANDVTLTRLATAHRRGVRPGGTRREQI
jgi:hypothetical protein